MVTMHLTGDTSAAEDLVQTTFPHVMRSAHTFYISGAGLKVFGIRSRLGLTGSMTVGLPPRPLGPNSRPDP